jgi:limonene-1,2-epoxide hydrolase
MKNEQVIRDFIAAWSRLDPDELAGYFTEDGVYHNVPTGPVRGREAVRKLIAGFIAPWTGTRWEICHLVARGDLVIVERVDRTRMGEKGVDLPCLGVFELDDGRIREWRDYFDLATYTGALGG